MMVEVLKRFKTDEGELSPGMQVDASRWRNLRGLINSRFVMPCEAQASLPQQQSSPLPETVTSSIVMPPTRRVTVAKRSPHA